MPIIDYYFICSSPFAYLGHKAFHDIARRHQVTIRYKPISIMGVWEQSGSVPLAQRTPMRQRYRQIELQRFAEMRGLPLNVQPRFFPVDPTLADRCVIAIVEGGGSPEARLSLVHKGLWADEKNIADREQLARWLAEAGHDAVAILEQAEAPFSGEVLARNTQAAIDAEAIGAPVYVLNGEPFWGQDRLDVLEHALASGRPPFRAM